MRRRGSEGRGARRPADEAPSGGPGRRGGGEAGSQGTVREAERRAAASLVPCGRAQELRSCQLAGEDL